MPSSILLQSSVPMPSAKKKGRGKTAYSLFAHNVAPCLWDRKPFDKHHRWFNFAGHIRNLVIEQDSRVVWEKYLEDSKLKDIIQTESQNISSEQQVVATQLFTERFTAIYNFIHQTSPSELIEKFNKEVLEKRQKKQKKDRTKTRVITDDIIDVSNEPCNNVHDSPEVHEILDDDEYFEDETASEIEQQIQEINSNIQSHKRSISVLKETIKKLQDEKKQLLLRKKEQLRVEVPKNVYVTINKK
jgi:hypothetical protein